MQLEIPRRALARIYGVSPSSLLEMEVRGADITSPEDLHRVVERTKERQGKLAILLNDPARRSEISIEIKNLTE